MFVIPAPIFIGINSSRNPVSFETLLDSRLRGNDRQRGFQSVKLLRSFTFYQNQDEENCP